MKLGIIVNTNDAETAWNALRLSNEAVTAGNEVKMFIQGDRLLIMSSKRLR
ncbi:MAG: hypothetical protein V3R96_05095 [Dehalococcoidales bacterium]